MKQSIHILLVTCLGFSAFAIALPTVSQPDDVFCKIIKRKAPAIIIYETQEIIVIEDRKKRSEVHCLIIPKKHIVNIKHLDKNKAADVALGSKMFEVAQFLGKQLEPSTRRRSGDFTLTINNGPTSEQTIPHMHMHFQSSQQWKSEFKKTFKVQK